MKKLISCLGYIIVLLLMSHLNVHAQVYVDLNATGSGDGSSWTNAYNDVQAAANGAAKGSSIWIAGGTYTLTQTLTLEESDLDIYGGFAGTETELGQRDFSVESILSGDVNGDDTPGDLVANSSDNHVHVLRITESTPTIIDGIVVEGGRGALTGTFANSDATGGGIICVGEISFINTKIRNNVARFGAGMYLINTGDIPGIYTFTSCEITGNEGNSFGGGIYAGFGGTQVDFTDCTFRANKASNGAGAYLAGASVVTQVQIDNCTFTENEASNFGGGFRLDGLATGTVEGTSFSKNKAVRGAGSAFFQAAVTFGDCLWEQNSCAASDGNPGLGGAVYLEEGCDITIDNSVLSENSAEDAGGAVLLVATEGMKNKLSMENCAFMENSTTDLGGAIYSQDPADIILTNNTFIENTGIEGGAIYIENDANASIERSRFEANTATWGGAILYNDISSSLALMSSDFVRNSVTNQGGAIYNTEGSPWTISNCLFESNSAGDWGGAAFLIADNTDNETNIERCRFISNSSIEVAGAIFHENGKMVVSNSLFYDNEASGDGIGNSISTNSTDSEAEPTLLINNTFHENAEGLGDVTPYSNSDTEHKVEVQNCIFSGSGVSWMIEAGNVTQTSLGGNLATSEIADLLLHNTDQLDTDPLFTDPDNGNLTLQEGSPAINAGVTDGAPTTDITGAIRDDMPDAGAYESGAVTAAHDVEKLYGKIQLLGNPVYEHLLVKWSGEPLLQGRFQVADVQGTILLEQRLDIIQDIQVLNIEDLASGNYFVVLRSGRGVAVVQFSKM